MTTQEPRGPQHTPGKWQPNKNPVYHCEIVIKDRFGLCHVAAVKTDRSVGADCGGAEITRENQEANARIIIASVNAFDTAAARLNLNAVELAERLQDGGIAELVEALEFARDWGKFNESAKALINAAIDNVRGLK